MIEVLENSKDPLIYTVKMGETRDSIAKKFGVSIQNVDTIEMDELLCGDKVIVDINEKLYHIVRPAERLCDISQKYNVPVEKLKEINNTTQVFVGQRLLISC